MPIPTKQPNETDKQFVQRCMINATMVKEFPDVSQRSAVCYKQLEK